MNNEQALNRLFTQHKVAAKITNSTQGSTIARYEAQIDPYTVRMDAFFALEDNIAHLLRAPRRPVIFPIYEKGVIAIDVPTGRPPDLHLRDILNETKEVSDLYALPLILGHSVQGTSYLADLVEMPHLLIAGTTGSGKSVGLKSMITALAYFRPKTEFVFMDPKYVELSVFSDTKTGQVLTAADQVLAFLEHLEVQVEDRYAYMRTVGASNITEITKKGFSYIVIVIDELADLFASHKGIKDALCKIVQKSRAAGVHVIAATQRPSVDVVSGLVKANFPGRIAYRMSSHNDSKTILGTAGAEKLLGKGDLLYRKTGGAFERIQGPYIERDDIKKILKKGLLRRLW